MAEEMDYLDPFHLGFLPGDGTIVALVSYDGMSQDLDGSSELFLILLNSMVLIPSSVVSYWTYRTWFWQLCFAEIPLKKSFCLAWAVPPIGTRGSGYSN